MKPFLLLGTREDDGASADEVRCLLELSGLDADRLELLRLENTPLPHVDHGFLGRYAGIVVGGSPFTSSDPEVGKTEVQRRCEADLSRLLDVVVPLDFPFLGACYGVGTLGLHQGAAVDRTYGEPVGTAWVELTAAGRADPITAGIPDGFAAFVGHKEAVRELPRQAVLLAGSADCPVQMFRIKRNLYATQFHPELDQRGLATRIRIYREAGYFPPHQAEELIDRVMETDAPWPPWILRNFVERYG